MWKTILLFCLFCLNAKAAAYLDIIKKHCYECHGPEDPDAALNLTIFEDKNSFYVQFDTLKDFYDAVKFGDMPPEDESKMTSAERKIIVDHLGSIIKRIETTASNKTGPTIVRRLTDYEYDNTVQSITGARPKPS